jgi:diaminopimelate decarboxylase
MGTGRCVKKLKDLQFIQLIGIHFHVGSQITQMSVFQSLCSRIKELQEWFSSRNAPLRVINIGGGLGIDYENPENQPKFKEYFPLSKNLSS